MTDGDALMQGDQKQPLEHVTPACSPQKSIDSGESISPDRPLLSLPKDLRFKSRGQFQRAQQSGRRIYTRHLIAYVVKNAQRPTRLGVTVSKKVGKAHYRSYIKRLLREAFRHSELRQSSGFDVSLIAKRDLSPPPLEELISELNTLKHNATKERRERRGRPRSHQRSRRGSQRGNAQKSGTSKGIGASTALQEER